MKAFPSSSSDWNEGAEKQAMHRMVAQQTLTDAHPHTALAPSAPSYTGHDLLA